MCSSDLWQTAVSCSSGLAIIAGLMVWLLGDGPHLPVKPGGVARRPLAVFRIPEFRVSALGYFGHMWEVYAFWALVPTLVAWHFVGASSKFVSIGSFAIVGTGGLGCVLGGMVSQRLGSYRVALISLSISGCCCLLFPLLGRDSGGLAFGLLLVWGISVAADSPQFSALSAKACRGQNVGSALAIQNSVGFAITMVAIELSGQFWQVYDSKVGWFLLIGPIFGIGSLVRYRVKRGGGVS